MIWPKMQRNRKIILYLVFQIKKTEIVNSNIVWAKGQEGVRGDWKVRGGQLIPGKGPEWMGIRHHEQDIGLPSKWGFPFTFNARE
jgi:hypothetical protein